MLHLYLFRHAKSSWDSAGNDDFDRPLNARGRAAAPAMAGHMAASGITPEIILCSAAQRARETLGLAIPAFDHDCVIRIERSLYLADAATLLERVKSLPADARQCMLIGHNPGFEHLAQLLAGNGTADEMRSLRAKFPTAAVAEITFAQPRWDDIAPGTGHLQRFVIPRALPAEI